MANPHLHVRYKDEVRAWWVILVACGCYQPGALASGSPCSVDQPTCPTGQTCIRVDGVFRCEVNPGSNGPDAPLSNDGPPPGTHRIAYPTTASACVSAEFPGETVCTDIYSPDALVLTKLDAVTMMPLTSYLRFDLDGALAGSTVAAVTLQLTAMTTAQAASDQSGTVWEANSFTQASIDDTTPGKTSMAVLASDRGAVAKGAIVEWPLASTLVSANSVLCLELESESTNNVIYDRSTPPTLFVDVF
jgi:hypothetical protein